MSCKLLRAPQVFLSIFFFVLCWSPFA
jgi:hypothetical protein